MTAPTFWPVAGDTPLAAARKVATVYRTHLHTANKSMCDQIDAAMESIGQRWIVPQLVTTEAETLVEVDEAAAIAGVSPVTVRQWRTRGYVDRDGTRAHLQVRGLSEGGNMMFKVGELLEVAAVTRAGRRSA